MKIETLLMPTDFSHDASAARETAVGEALPTDMWNLLKELHELLGLEA